MVLRLADMTVIILDYQEHRFLFTDEIFCLVPTTLLSLNPRCYIQALIDCIQAEPPPKPWLPGPMIQIDRVAISVVIIRVLL